jgi:predicted AlkP superfamily phosphohydrolase/phosphomutase
MIGLDAAEPSLVERWMDDGTLPSLKRLYAEGAYGRLASTADWLAGSPWPTFYTSALPTDHGLYHSPQWRADQMRHVRPSHGWLPLRPFWINLSETGHRVIIVDMPMKFPPEPFNGVEVYGWATHDRLGSPTSYPQSMVDWVRREYGPPLSDEPWGPQRIKSSFQLRDELIQVTLRTVDLAKVLMKREQWDLFIVGFGATHRGGHKLWDFSGLLGNMRSSDRTRFSQALRDVYVACDAAVGQLVEAAGDGVTVLVFSLHGMGPNTSRVCLLPTMLDRILGKEPASGTRPLRRRLIEAIPPGLRYGNNLFRLLPSSLR